MSFPLPSEPSPFKGYPTTQGKSPPPAPSSKLPPDLQEHMTTPTSTTSVLKAKSWSQAKAEAKEAISQFFRTASPIVLTSQDQKKLLRYLEAKLHFERAFERMSVSGKKEHEKLFEEAASSQKELSEALHDLMQSSKKLTDLAAVLQHDLPVFMNNEKLITLEGEEERSELRGQYDRYRKLLDSLQEALEGWDKKDKRVPAQRDAFLSELKGRIEEDKSSTIETLEETRIPKQKLTLGLLFARLKAKFLSQIKVKTQELLASAKAKLSEKKIPSLDGPHLKALQNYLESHQAVLKAKKEVANYVEQHSKDHPSLIKDLIEQQTADPKLSNLLKVMKEAQARLTENQTNLKQDTVANLHFQRILNELTEYTDANSAYALRYQELAMNQNAPAGRLREQFIKAFQAKERADRATSTLQNDPQYGPIVQNSALLSALMQLVKERLEATVVQRMAQSGQEAAKEEHKRQVAEQIVKDRRMGKAGPKPYLQEIQEVARQAGPEGAAKRLLAIAKMELEGMQRTKRENSKLDEVNLAEKEKEVARLQGIEGPAPAPDLTTTQKEDIIKLIERDAKLQQLKSELDRLNQFPLEENVEDFLQRLAQVEETKKQILALDPAFSFVEPEAEQPPTLQLNEDEKAILHALTPAQETPPPKEREQFWRTLDAGLEEIETLAAPAEPVQRSEKFFADLEAELDELDATFPVPSASILQLPSELTESAIIALIQRINAIDDEIEQKKQIEALDALMEKRPEVDQKLFQSVLTNLLRE